MPATSVRDLVIKDDDLVIGTHGRSFWILDDITPLRQLTNLLINQSATLYKPQDTYRVRWSMYTDTPVPQEEPAGQNPPDGAIINYYLNEKVKAVSLEITDVKGRLVKKYTSNDTLYKIGDVNIPHYWIRPQQTLSGEPGSHRFMWDMKYDALNIPPSYPIGATYMNTAPDQTAPWVMPGTYIARLTVDGKVLDQSFIVKIDPRVKTLLKDLQAQHDLSIQCYEGRKQCMKILEEIRLYRLMLRGQMTNPPSSVADELNKKDKQAALLENSAPGTNEASFGRLNNSFASIFAVLQDSDQPPATQAIAALADTQKQLQQLITKWNMLKPK